MFFWLEPRPALGSLVADTSPKRAGFVCLFTWRSRDGLAWACPVTTHFQFDLTSRSERSAVPAGGSKQLRLAFAGVSDVGSMRPLGTSLLPLENHGCALTVARQRQCLNRKTELKRWSKLGLMKVPTTGRGGTRETTPTCGRSLLMSQGLMSPTGTYSSNPHNGQHCPKHRVQVVDDAFHHPLAPLPTPDGPYPSTSSRPVMLIALPPVSSRKLGAMLSGASGHPGGRT